MVFPVTMDFFDHSYYRLNKILMMCIGQWADQSTRTKRVCRTVLVYFYVTEIMSRIRTMRNNPDAENIIMDAILPIFFQIIGLVYFLTFLLNSHTTLKLLNRIRTDWQVWAREREVNILHEYTDLGRKINIAFTATVYVGGSVVGIEPVVEKIIDILLRNGTAPGRYMFLVDYYHVDEQKYFFYVTAYYLLMVVAVTAPNIIQIVMLVSFAQHGNGIFAALRYVNLIEAAYTWNCFVSIGLFVIMMNALGLQILTQPNNLQVKLTFGGCSLIMGLCFLMWCTASQILIDHSISIRLYIYNSPWYRLSPKTQKLLQFMMMRCNVPSQLTAGNMLILSVRTTWLMLKTVVSYFAFVRSTQGV